MEISCIVLAGGEGLRLGRNKALATVGGTSLFQRVLLSIGFLNSEIIVVTGIKRPFTDFAGYPNLRIVTDIYPGKGPLGGIYTGMLASETPYNLVVACDMPFLKQRLLGYMIQLAAGFDIVVPRVGKMVEPLHAVYSERCISFLEDMVKQDNLSVNHLFGRMKVRYLEADEIDRFDPGHLSFFNVNTEADLKTAQQLAKGEIVLNDQR